MIKIRKYKSGEEVELWNIFFNTVRKVNIKDYTYNQINAWAPEEYAEAKWSKKIKSINPFVAISDGKIVGYADLQANGYIDHFYCHHQYQRKGIGKALIIHLIDVGFEHGIKNFFCQVSITARPFFERFGFKVVKQQQVKIRGEILKNYLMERSVQSSKH
jgi:putative acetyltransferase